MQVCKACPSLQCTKSHLKATNSRSLFGKILTDLWTMQRSCDKQMIGTRKAWMSTHWGRQFQSIFRQTFPNEKPDDWNVFARNRNVPQCEELTGSANISRLLSLGRNFHFARVAHRVDTSAGTARNTRASQQINRDFRNLQNALLFFPHTNTTVCANASNDSTVRLHSITVGSVFVHSLNNQEVGLQSCPWFRG